MSEFSLENLTRFTYSDDYGSTAIITSSDGDLVLTSDYNKLLEAYEQLKFRMGSLED